MKWKEFAKQIFEMELHRRGSKRYIILPSRRSDASSFRFLIFVFLVSVFTFLAAKPLIFRRACEINLLTVLAHA